MKKAANIYTDMALSIIQDQLLSDITLEVKERIFKWLKEESYQPTEGDNPDATFLLRFKAFGVTFAVLQQKGKMDSVFVGSKMGFSKSQSERFGNLSAGKRHDFIWETHLALVRDPELSVSELGPNLPQDFSEVTIQSKPIFYDALTKDRFISSIMSVYKAQLLVLATLEKYSGSGAPTSFSPSKFV